MHSKFIDSADLSAQELNKLHNNFQEVAKGMTEEEAQEEAAKCLHCKKPLCVHKCPVAIDIPGFIAKIKERDYEGAYQIIQQSSSCLLYTSWGARILIILKIRWRHSCP